MKHHLLSLAKNLKKLGHAKKASHIIKLLDKMPEEDKIEMLDRIAENRLEQLRERFPESVTPEGKETLQDDLFILSDELEELEGNRPKLKDISFVETDDDIPF